MSNKPNFLIDGTTNSEFADKLEAQLKIFESEPYFFSNIDFYRRKKKARLSFYPLSKNIRMIASVIASNLQKNRETKFSNYPRAGEEKFVTENLGWKDWHPWVWSLNETLNHKGQEAWEDYFVFNGEKLGDNIKEIKKMRGASFIESEILKLPFLFEAYRRVFQFSDITMQNLEPLLPEKLLLNVGIEPYFSVHIRRGENISEDESWTRANVPMVSIEKYAIEAKKMADLLQIGNVFVATDSDNSLDQFAKFCPDLKIFSNNLNRKYFFRPSRNQIEDVETYLRKNPKEVNFYAHSALADLFMMSKSKGIVGTLSVSEFTKTAWYLAMATSQKFVPFSSLSGPLDLAKSDSIYLN